MTFEWYLYTQRIHIMNARKNVYFIKMCAYIFKMCTVQSNEAVFACADDDDDDDDYNNSFSLHLLLPKTKPANISGGMKFSQMVNLVENILGALKHLRAFTSYFIHSRFSF